jgi:hypothetical protein
MQAELDEIEQEVRERLDALALNPATLEETFDGYDRLELEMAAKLRQAGGEDLVIRLQRTLALVRLMSVVQKQADPELAMTLLSRANAIGYETPIHKLTATGLFARVCLRNCDAALATRALEAIRATQVNENEADATFHEHLAALQEIARQSPTK